MSSRMRSKQLFEFETKRHRLSLLTSKNAQFMSTDILIHQRLSLAVTLVKGNRDGRNYCFNVMLLPKQEKAQQWLARKPVYGY
eukprot:4572324-Ditylum_brightwellii.AAC.1